jgi:hypothetical protein
MTAELRGPAVVEFVSEAGVLTGPLCAVVAVVGGRESSGVRLVHHPMKMPTAEATITIARKKPMVRRPIIVIQGSILEFNCFKVKVKAQDAAYLGG